MPANFIPEKFYVARTVRRGLADATLGFMVPMNKDGFDARKKTADSWAGDGVSAIEVDNTPTTGFSLTANKRRYMNKNVVWRVLHPLGFEFEITSDNFSDFMLDVKINQGVIETPMLFVRRNNENYLTYEGSDEHKKAITQAAMETKVSVKDLKPGMRIKLKDGREVDYQGAAHAMYLSFETRKQKEVKPDQYDYTKTKSKRYHFIGKGLNLRAETSLNVIEIVGETPEQDRIDNIVEHINRTINPSRPSDIQNSSFSFVACREKPFKYSDLKPVYTEIHNLTQTDYEYMRYSQSSSTLFLYCKKKTGEYFTPYMYNDSHYGQPTNWTNIEQLTVEQDGIIVPATIFNSQYYYMSWDIKKAPGNSRVGPSEYVLVRQELVFK